ncbi:MAG: hypothetical protein M3Y58_20915 [Chloroflexota bacterium]|nr:hypothetical protein [Chloroflexota bacterium]
MEQHDDRECLRRLRTAFNDAHAVGNHVRGMMIVRETTALIARMRRHIEIVRDANTPREAGRQE